MQRRDFFKITAATGALAALEGCGNPDHQLIRFIPEEDLTPGIAAWKPSICTMCGAGCGTLVRVMQGEAEVIRNGELGLIKMGLAKKIEGNPADPVSQGKLCPRGQAGLQVTYHPDRIKQPLALTGQRGLGEYTPISWDDAEKRLASQLGLVASAKQKGSVVFLAAPLMGQRKTVVENFANALGGTLIEYSVLDRSVQEQANAQSFGVAALPTLDLGQSNYIISFGADFLGTWNSPVAQSMGYGKMRQGRPGQRGKLVACEARISQTGANADEFVACPPGMEGAFALSLANVILTQKLRPENAAGAAGSAIPGWSSGLTDYAPEKIAAHAGIDPAKLVRIAHEAAANGPAVALIGDVATAHTNGLFSALAVNALNELLGSVGKPGGIQFAESSAAANSIAQAGAQIVNAANGAKALLLHNANPVYGAPPAQGVRDALQKVPFIASFSSFLDETSVFADLILPDNSPLESSLDDPRAGSAAVVTAPVMSPIHDTKQMPDVLLAVAAQMGGDVAKALPWKTYDDAVKAATATSKNGKSGGGNGLRAKPAPVQQMGAQFDGDAGTYPFYFLPFASQMLYDGSLAHLPWLQEAPDPLSSAMWSSWVEIHPATAQKLGIAQADLIEVTSQHGSLRAPAMISPGVAPNAIAMPMGQGHESYTRYASGRGANPMSVLAPMTTETGSLAWAATRVKIANVGKGNLILFGGSLREAPQGSEPR